MLSRSINTNILKTYPKFIALSVLILSLLAPIPSHGAKGYRYWGYFQAAAGASSWTAAMTGPSVEVKDGDVEGWTFVFSSNDIPAIEPMMDPDFATLCGETPETSGKIRVGLVVDFGAGNIAPDHIRVDSPHASFHCHRTTSHPPRARSGWDYQAKSRNQHPPPTARPTVIERAENLVDTSQIHLAC